MLNALHTFPEIYLIMYLVLLRPTREYTPHVKIEIVVRKNSATKSSRARVRQRTINVG